MKTIKNFQEFVDTLDHIEVCRITIAPDGEFSVPSETDGRITQVSQKTRLALAQFMTEFSKRLRCGEIKKKKERGDRGSNSSRSRRA